MEINQIVHGDCLSVVANMADNSVDLVVTSPPYFNAKEYSQYNSIQDYMTQMREIFAVIYRKLKESRMCVVNISPVLVQRKKRSMQSYRIPLPFYFVPMMEEVGFEFLEDIIWMKPEGAVPNRNGGFYRHRKPIAYKPNVVTEYVLVFKKAASFLIDKVLEDCSLVGDGYERTNVWQISPDGNSWHPAPFPLGLAMRVIEYYSYRGGLVLDPFIGSGTTAIAAENLGREWLGVEKEEIYVKMARGRIAKERLKRSQLPLEL